ncbi:unnamed protein product [Dovyalis caffra]|uniref:Uncharacterized protein n=1 Tax=Dovyalis caffra TaxID=77055 RepID=A0AAV1QNB5_9ROSI|nr:unnamed protein product [Dovyalis caffra]
MTNLTKNRSSYTLRGVSRSNTACANLLLIQSTRASRPIRESGALRDFPDGKERYSLKKPLSHRGFSVKLLWSTLRIIYARPKSEIEETHVKVGIRGAPLSTKENGSVDCSKRGDTVRAPDESWIAKCLTHTLPEPRIASPTSPKWDRRLG